MKIKFSKKGFTLAEFFIVMIGLGTLFSSSLPDQKGSTVQAVYTLDTKLDDGNGATGGMRALYHPILGTDEDFCVDENGVYKINDSTATICNFLLKY